MNDRKIRRRRRSSNGFLDILNGLLTLLVLGLLLAGGVVLYGASQFYGDGPLTADTTFRVEAGSGLSSIGPRQSWQGWRDLEVALSKQLKESPGGANPYGMTLLLMGTLLATVTTFSLARQPQEVTAALWEMLRL